MTFFIIGIIVWIVRDKYRLSWRQSIGFFLVGAISINLLRGVIEALYYGNFSYRLMLFIIFMIFLYLKRDTEGKYIQEWENTNFPSISSFEFSTILMESCNTSNVRYSKDIPCNRAKYFSSGTEADIDMDSVSNIFYDAKPADNEMSFQEYGFLVTSLGVIINKQIGLPKNGRKKSYDIEKSYLPFANAYRTKTTVDSITVYYANRTKETVILNSETLDFISNVFLKAIESGWTYHVESIITANGVVEEELEIIDRDVASYQMRMDNLDSAIVKGINRDKMNVNNKQVANAAVAGSLSSINSELNQNQINDRFGRGQGHGHAGEQFGDLGDKLRLKDTEKMGSSHEKHGADRKVNGVNIQTKYHATAGKSIDSCFNTNGGKALYLNPDGSMMKIEVPKDQYDAALKNMAKKIEQGRVPNESDPKNAGNYVKKGAITYEHSQIATKSIFDRKTEITVRDDKGKVVRDPDGNIVSREVTFSEKLIWSAGGDFLTGATAALPFGVVSGLWVYCNSVWQGADKKTAFRNSVIATAKPTLTGGIIYMVSSQFAGSQIGKTAGDLYANTIVKKQLTNKAKTQAVTKGTMGVITVVITIGPDLTDCLRGRMSMKQLVKNTVSTGIGMASGTALGSAVGSVIPGIGNAVGAVVGGSVGAISARKALDNFIEDDAVEMISIAKEEFIETVMMSGLSEEEFQNVLKTTFLHKKFNKLLKTMYASNDSRDYIHKYFLDLVEKTYLNRELPNEADLVEVGLIYYEDLVAV